MTTKDPYEILGVSRTATADEIKRAYRRLVKDVHPDHNPGDKNAEKQFKEVQAAYEVLGDPKRRDEFDKYGAGGPVPDYQQWARGAPHGQSGNVHVDFDSMGDLGSIFEQFFGRGANRRNGGGRRTRDMPPGENIEHAVEITFEEALRGTTREVAFQGEDRRVVERIEVKIPPGIGDGQAVRVKGRGQEGGGGRGDLIIRVHVRPHPYFRREGLDIYVDLPLTVPEAILGTRVDIPTPDGTTTRLVVPPGTSSGMKLRLRGKGVTDARAGTTGDLYTVAKISVPREPSARLRSTLEELRDEFGPDPRREIFGSV